jgi:hypothetical protein
MHIKLVFVCAVPAQAKRSASTAITTADRMQPAAAEKTATSRQTRAARHGTIMAARLRVVHGEQRRGAVQHSANMALRKAMCRAQRGGARSHRLRSMASAKHWVCGGECSRADTCESARSSAAHALVRSSAIPWRCRRRCPGPAAAGIRTLWSQGADGISCAAQPRDVALLEVVWRGAATGRERSPPPVNTQRSLLRASARRARMFPSRARHASGRRARIRRGRA